MFKNTSRRKRSALLGISTAKNERYAASTKNYYISSNPITLSVPAYAEQVSTAEYLPDTYCTEIQNEYNQLKTEIMNLRNLFVAGSSITNVINTLAPSS